MEITEDERKALERFLTWMRGFDESVLYDDYKEYENFTDEEYAMTLQTLWNIVNRAK